VNGTLSLGNGNSLFSFCLGHWNIDVKDDGRHLVDGLWDQEMA
jgi:hypothetical protein